MVYQENTKPKSKKTSRVGLLDLRLCL